MKGSQEHTAALEDGEIHVTIGVELYCGKWSRLNLYDQEDFDPFVFFRTTKAGVALRTCSEVC